MNAPKLSTQADRDLLDKVAAGDRAAFEELYLAYYGRLARFLTRLTRRQDFIEEIINDTLWVVWRKAKVFRGDSQPSTWIMGIGYRCALKALRSSDHRIFEAAPIDEQTMWAHDEIGSAETSEWLKLGMQELSPEQRMTLELSYGQGHSCEEIGKIMDCSPNTVKTRMFHARAKLRAILPRLAGIDRVVNQ